ncbi:23S rRNA (adenine(2030)-N(6))-methyltransferase RlmJ [Hahella sp. KA22]|uniref:23S rRNA (adenine(2030)-N(6))-methyltransferase RlmJ n=1 Tax=Hahella sp. KA22 TaxID=1628392 RepID=UPI000FDEFABC|nr:23S rRNA (adenine(2030)-N(6))-methyltransferase RlmJ [Hahella sp. KA22]AZZ90052.1 23S rRNA (adenine(2030)-N(6))-methyltransferase RlmJ [Hahella sp. KA22]QAY53422.1 23S rRNA (adenine(2030)-N(6))-methyltransferase RlmJ [Hahella sp. KA22]
MLSYQHVYHAGNFADAHKHWVLSLLLQALCKKSTPWRYLETHAGRGDYDLTSEEAQKTSEWTAGILPLMQAKGTCPPEFDAYLAAVRGLNPDAGKLTRYPGSPAIAAGFLRETDQLALCELHPKEYAELKRQFGRNRQIHIHQRDGFEGVMAMSPPPEKRGLVMIDPSYELKDDYQRIPAYISKLTKKWSNAVIAIWYPVLAEKRHEQMLELMRQLPLHKTLRSELILTPVARGMYGSGMLVVNPPWRLDEQLQAGWAHLSEALRGDPKASCSADWLIAE